jgi:hypothetical protein
MAIAMDPFRPEVRIRLGGRIHARHYETVNSTKRSMCVLALVILLLTVGVGGSLSRETSAAVARVLPTGNFATVAAFSPEPNADGWNNDMATVTLSARYKGH